jgi:N utilization substance protein B
MARKRHLSRIAVMQVLFEREYREIDDIKSLQKNMKELGNVDEEFALTLLEGSISMADELKKVIESKAPEWSFDRMDPIARPVLIMGAFELLYADDAPPAVVMNECIEISKDYGTEETSKFVNGVLNALAKA